MSAGENANQLAAICGYCDALLMPDETAEHFNLHHPTEEDWRLRTDENGVPQYVEVPKWIEDDR